MKSEDYNRGQRTRINIARTVALLLFLVLAQCLRCEARDFVAMKGLSPKLMEFLNNHPVAASALTKAAAEAFGSKKFEIFYFYSDDESVARARHTYPTISSVEIIVRENQLPSDEYICLFFEILNSESEQNFQKLGQMAKSGTISRMEFARGIMKQEFEALKRTRNQISGFGLSPREISESYSYNRFMQCPDNFDEFLSYVAKVSPQRHQLEQYEKYYDSITQKSPPVSN